MKIDREFKSLVIGDKIRFEELSENGCFVQNIGILKEINHFEHYYLFTTSEGDVKYSMSNKNRMRVVSFLIHEQDGWKMYENEEIRCHEFITPDGFIQKVPFLSAVYNVQKFYEAVKRGWIWVDVEYYSGTIEDSKIVVEKRNKQVRSNKHQLFLDTHDITETAVKEKLKPILEKAEKKFDKINKIFTKLLTDEDCDISYTMNGDTYGIYEDYMYISFNIEGVFCKFRIEE